MNYRDHASNSAYRTTSHPSNQHSTRTSHHTKGFTLLELMVTLGIVCILVAVALPAYRSYILRGHRADGKAALLDVALAEEKYRASNDSYAALASIWTGTQTDGGYYTLATSGLSATGFTLTATANGTQADDTQDGTSCATLTLTTAGGIQTRTPAICWK